MSNNAPAANGSYGSYGSNGSYGAKWWALYLFFLLLALLPAAAQDGVPDETILIDLTINHGVAYREGGWVPVDIFVNNTERDVEGHLEVTFYDFSNARLSPVYRVPAVSPKGSRKHFRAYCKVERANRVEVQLYHGNRPAVPVPTWLNVAPIEQTDFLGLVLDDNHHDYGFLSSEEVIGKSEVRFHREGLSTDQLGLLADRLPCYTAFDLIVLGDIDPERIAPEQRELLQQYVELGGTLAISLGENAGRYKGSWLEPLMGVSIGENQFTSEDTLASHAFGRGAVEQHEAMVTGISPAGESVYSIAANFAVGAINTVGNGRVATFTVDAESGMLQKDPDFLRAWGELLQQGILDRPLNLPSAVGAAIQFLPAIAGVKLFPVSSVITYLLLYFFIAIVANWAFWNWRKRREMAWVCLVFFSLAFTSYAMFFGTQGRARSTRLEQLEILEMNANNPGANLHGITGLLAKGSGRFSGTLIHPRTLASDGASAGLASAADGMNFGAGSPSPFQFVQGEPATVENVAVGASEMRFLQTEAPLELPGAFEADVRMVGGDLKGVVTNNTGLKLEDLVLFHQGRPYYPQWNGASATIDTTQSSPGTSSAVVPRMQANRTATTPSEYSDFTGFLADIPGLLLGEGLSHSRPCLVAWVDAPPIGSIDFGSRAEPHLGATLAVVWLDVAPERSNDPVSLRVRFSRPQATPNDYNFRLRTGLPLARETEFLPDVPATAEAWAERACPISVGKTWALELWLPAWARASGEYDLQLEIVTANATYTAPADKVTLYGDEEGPYHPRCDAATTTSGGRTMTLLLNDESTRNVTISDPTLSTTPLVDNVVLTSETYTIQDWKNWLRPRSTALKLKLTAAPINGVDTAANARGRTREPSPHYHAYVAARLIKRTPPTVGE